MHLRLNYSKSAKRKGGANTACTRRVGLAAFSGGFVAGSWSRQSGVLSSRPPAGNADRWAAKFLQALRTMKQSLSENRIAFLFIAGAVLVLIAGLMVGIPEIIIFGLGFLIVAFWIQANLVSVDFDTQWLYITKRSQTIEVPIHRIEYVTELVGSGMSTCFMGFKSPTLFGSRIMFLGFPYRKSLDQLVSIAKSQGNEIKVNGWLS